MKNCNKVKEKNNLMQATSNELNNHFQHKHEGHLIKNSKNKCSSLLTYIYIKDCAVISFKNSF